MPLPAITAGSETGCTKRPSTPVDAAVARCTATSRRRAASATRPPSRAIASSLACGACSGTAIVAGTPSSRAIQATPCAMLPALAVTSPRATSAGSALRTALAAPRILNELIGCSVSSLHQISAGASSTCSRTSGVRTAAPGDALARGDDVLDRDRDHSSTSTPAPARPRARDGELGGGEILDGDPERAEHGQRAGAAAARVQRRQRPRRARRGCARARRSRPRSSASRNSPASCGGRLARVDEQLGGGDVATSSSRARRHARADRVDVRAGGEPGALDHGRRASWSR